MCILSLSEVSTDERPVSGRELGEHMSVRPREFLTYAGLSEAAALEGPGQFELGEKHRQGRRLFFLSCESWGRGWL